MPRNSFRTTKILPVCRADDEEARAKAGVCQPMAQNAAKAAKQTSDVLSSPACPLPDVDSRPDLAILRTQVPTFTALVEVSPAAIVCAVIQVTFVGGRGGRVGLLSHSVRSPTLRCGASVGPFLSQLFVVSA